MAYRLAAFDTRQAEGIFASKSDDGCVPEILQIIPIRRKDLSAQIVDAKVDGKGQRVAVHFWLQSNKFYGPGVHKLFSPF